MASRTSLRLRGLSPYSRVFFNLSSRSSSSSSPYSKVYFLGKNNNPRIRNCSAESNWSGVISSATRCSQFGPNSSDFTGPEREFAPKIRQARDWLGQLQAVDLGGVEPAVRADTVHDNMREDIPETFENGEEIIASIPSYEDPHIKVLQVFVQTKE